MQNISKNVRRSKIKFLDKVKEPNFSYSLNHNSQKVGFTPFADLYTAINETKLAKVLSEKRPKQK